MAGVGRARRTSIGSFVQAVHREALWPGVLLLLGGAGGTVFAHLAATWPSDPASGFSMAATALVVVASLAALGIGAEIVVSVEQSTMRHVFVSDSLRRAAVALVAGAALLVVTPVLLGCFDDVLLGSGVTASVVAGIGMLGGALAMSVVAGVARWLGRLAGTEEEREL